MKRNLSTLLPVVAVLAAAFIPWNQARAQAPSPDAPLAEQLKALYKVTKFGAVAKGFAVLSPGTVLVIRKAGILGVPPANVAFGDSIYRDGELHQPTAGNRTIIGNVTRFLQVGEKVYVQTVDVNLKSDRVTLFIVECDSCNGVDQQSSFKSMVSFEFAKGSLATADPAQIENTIGQVLSIDNSSNGGQQPQDSSAQQQGQQQQPPKQQAPPPQPQDSPAQQQGQRQQPLEQQPHPPQPQDSSAQQQGQRQQPPEQQAPPPQPPTIQLGQTVDKVQAVLGEPDKIVNLGAKLIYVYKDLKVTFMNGKVADAQ